MSKINNVNSWNGWDPLEQVVLGNCYNPSFFEPVKDPRTRDLLQRLLYETQEDLANIKRCLEMEGVDVVQIAENTAREGIVINSVEQEEAFVEPDDNSARLGGIMPPMLTPRDEYITLGNKLVSTTAWKDKRDLIASYMENPDEELVSPFYDAFPQTSKEFSAPSITRLGKRVIIDDEGMGSAENADFLMSHFPEFEIVTHTVGGHNDGCFCPMKPGEIISTTWVEMTDYSKTVPNWNVRYLKSLSLYADKERAKQYLSIKNKRKEIDKYYWHPDAKEDKFFADYIDAWLNEWVGYSTESIFEVNMLVINPELVFCPTFNEEAFRHIENIGMTPVHVPFRHRQFWDGGLHCLTLDTRRKGGQQDYWK